MNRPAVHYIALAAAVLIAAALYFPGLSGGYLFDDSHVIQSNAAVKSNAGAFDTFALIAAAESFAAGGRQLSMLTFALNFLFFGDSLWWLKAVNLLIHLLNGVGLYLLTARIAARTGGQGGVTDHARYLPLAVAAVWMVHPINLTTVLYISQRMALLSAFFTIWGIWAYLLCRQAALGRPRKIAYLAIVMVGFTLVGYRAKENAILLPGYLFIIELCVFRFRKRHTEEPDREVLGLYLLGITALACALVWQFYQDPQWLVRGYESRHFSLFERVLTQFRALSFYLGQMLLPSNDVLSLRHDDFAVSKSLLSPISTLWSLLALCALFATALVGLKRFPLPALGMFWFFVSHSIESTVFPLELVHEHRNYLASYGIMLATISAAGLLLRCNRIWLCMVMVGFLVSAVVLHERSRIWGDEFRHMVHESTIKPGSAAAAYRHGFYYYKKAMAGDDEAIAPALRHIERAARNDAYSNIAELLLVAFSAHPKVAYDPRWLESATEKLRKYPFMAPSKAALKGFFGCLRRRDCNPPEADVEKLMQAAFDSGDGHLMTAAGFYYLEIAQDAEKADTAFAGSLERRDASTWVNYLKFLLHTEKKPEACRQMQRFEQLVEQDTFTNFALFAVEKGWLDAHLQDCPL